MDYQAHPKCVGQEFVRQYYTILNQEPDQLHRFYTENSSFAHGGLDEELNQIVGLEQISEKIKELNFRDCHAKIIQVECQDIPENGIFIQVIGELSNRGQAMRPFTQTFILAYVSLKNYYVCNNIFRYQDMLGDDEIEHESSRSAGDDEVQAQLEQGHTDEVLQTQIVASPLATVQPTTNAVVKSLPLVPIVNSTIHTDVVLQTQIVTPKLATVQPTTNAVVKSLPLVPIVNSTIHTDVVLQTQIVTPKLATTAPTTPITASVVASHLISKQVPAANASIQTQQRAWKIKPQKPESVTQIQIENIEVVGEETVESQTVESPIKQEKDLQPEHVTANETETSSTSLNSAAPTSPDNEWKIKQPRKIRKPKPPTISPLEQRETASSTTANTSGAIARAQGGRGAKGPERGGNNVRGMNRNDRPGPTTRAYYKNEDNGITKYSDGQQLFLGNIPTYVTEEELKKFFTKFGNVIDVRIFINRNNKNMPEDRVRNFGYIIFETMESAKSVLVEKRIILSDQNGDHRINVQEKKPRANQAMDGSRIRESGNSMAPGQNDAKENGMENNDNQVANNVQSGSGGVTGGSPKIRDGDTGRGMPRRGARGGSGGGRGRGDGNMPRGTDSRRN